MQSSGAMKKPRAVDAPKTAPDSDVLPLERFHKAVECLKSAVRLYKVYGDYLAEIRDPETHRREAADSWDTCYRGGRICAKRRMGH